MHFPSKIQKLLGWCLVILPACFLGILISIYSVNFPYWDQWAIAPLFEKAHNGSLSLSDLLAQHNESRKFFPRLVFIGLAYLTYWDVRYEMLIIFLLACLVSLNVYYLSQKTFDGSTIKKLFIAFIANLLIFSSIQWENWLWGIQIVVFVPIACITTCVVVAYSALATRTKFLVSMCLSTVSTFSYANGILCWIVVLPILLLKSWNEVAKNKWLVFTWIAGFISNALVYFYNYKKPSHHPSFLYAITHPQEAILYFLSFLGAPLAFGSTINPLILAPIVGLALILLFLASYFYVLKVSKTSVLLHRVAGWLTIGTYTVISGVITTFGRVGFGVQQSLDSRYTTFSVYLAVSLIYIVVIIADDIKRKDYLSKSQELITSSTSFLVATVLILHLFTSIYAVQKMSEARLARLQAKSCLMFINLVQEECLTKNVFPQLAYLKPVANSIDSLGFLKPGLVKSSNIRDIEGASKLGFESYGWFDNLTKVGTNLYVASGWAVLPERGEPADAVVLTYENANGASTVFTVVDDTKNTRDDVAKALRNKSYSNSGWQKSFSSISLPKEATKISAWAFDAKIGKAFKLSGTHIIKAKSPSPLSFLASSPSPKVTSSSTNLALLGVKDIGEIKFKTTGNFSGYFDMINRSTAATVEVPKATPITATGWAIIPKENKAADKVIITYGENNSLVTVAPVNEKRPDVVKVLKNLAYSNSGWGATFSPSTLPAGEVVLKAWAYNSTSKEATQLNSTHEVLVIE